jgi:hypothetical protein
MLVYKDHVITSVHRFRYVTFSCVGIQSVFSSQLIAIFLSLQQDCPTLLWLKATEKNCPPTFYDSELILKQSFAHSVERLDRGTGSLHGLNVITCSVGQLPLAVYSCSNYRSATPGNIDRNAVVTLL